MNTNNESLKKMANEEIRKFFTGENIQVRVDYNLEGRIERIILENQEDKKNAKIESNDKVETDDDYIIVNKELEVTNIMNKIGIPVRLKGYKYLRTAIIEIMDKPELIESLSKALYPRIAEIYDTRPQRVQRAIRTAISVTWKKIQPEVIKDIFGYDISEKPTNWQFISMITDLFLLQ